MAQADFDAAGLSLAGAEESLALAISQGETRLAETSDSDAADPQVLTDLREAVENAKLVEPFNVPEPAADAAALRAQAEDIVGAASAAEKAAAAVEAAIGAVDASVQAKAEAATKGEFDLLNRDGYTYHVEYSINPRFETDATEGKPGQVALYLDLSGCSVTVTNTTPGKKAPGIYFDAAPLYSTETFPEIDAQFSPFATFGALASPLSATTATRSELYQAMTPSFFDPFDNDPDMRQYFDFLGSISDTYITAGVARRFSGVGYLDGGGEFDVGESRTLELSFATGASGSMISSQYSRSLIGEIAEEYVERFEDPSGWALAPHGFIFGEVAISFIGLRNVASDLGNDFYLYTYAPAGI
ncbi:MAG: hypothetical protein LBU05_00880 [Bifidobacteriaceae bacterium]|nr:hypothetical protein [Bifidobacteriaceae bacterium]